MTHFDSAQRSLSSTLKGNGRFSISSGLLLSAFSGPVAVATGIEFPFWIMLTGIGLIGFGGFLFVLTLKKRPAPPAWLVWQVITGDLLWVLASAAGLALWSDSLTVIGKTAVLGIALIVATFACLQILHLHRRENARARKSE